jgi:hypothetical protein
MTWSGALGRLDDVTLDGYAVRPFDSSRPGGLPHLADCDGLAVPSAVGAFGQSNVGRWPTVGGCVWQRVAKRNDLPSRDVR